MKLHLGCGERYFEGYVNIDYPLTEHTVQKKSVADVQANLLTLRYETGTVDEIRLHHVFEHFSRSVACALLTNWYFWLKPGGVLHIEVPDFSRTARWSISGMMRRKRTNVGLRHIFGSQEAHWAVHYEGYSKKLLTKMLGIFGFRVKEVRRNSWKGTYNIEVIAIKDVTGLTIEAMEHRAEEHLRQYMVDDSESEQRLLGTWKDIYRQHVVL
jgi:predicted SAM-dependent methyltransferase